MSFVRVHAAESPCAPTMQHPSAQGNFVLTQGNGNLCDYFDLNQGGCICCWLTLGCYGVGLCAPALPTFRRTYVNGQPLIM
jgi:hypothetical protein